MTIIFSNFLLEKINNLLSGFSLFIFNFHPASCRSRVINNRLTFNLSMTILVFNCPAVPCRMLAILHLPTLTYRVTTQRRGHGNQFKKKLPESPCKSLVNNDGKIVFIDCCKDYPSANFGKGFGENLFLPEKGFSRESAGQN